MKIFSFLFSKVDKFNNRLADLLASSLSSMYFFWICFSIDLTQLLLQPPHSVQEWCTFVSQTVIQLLALPVLAFVSNKSGQEELRIIKEDLEIDKKDFQYTKNTLKKICNKLGIEED